VGKCVPVPKGATGMESHELSQLPDVGKVAQVKAILEKLHKKRPLSFFAQLAAGIF